MTERSPEQTSSYGKARNNEFHNSLSPELNKFVESLPQRIDAMNAKTSVKIREVHKTADLIFSEAAKFAVCSKGCSHCCYQAIPIAIYEARYIGEHINKPPIELKQRISRDVMSFSDQTPCPFLLEGECSIYEHRPLTCRTHVTFDKDNYWCLYENWDKPGAAIPKPVIKPLYFAYHQLAGKHQPIMGDIRDFFPTGPAI